MARGCAVPRGAMREGGFKQEQEEGAVRRQEKVVLVDHAPSHLRERERNIRLKTACERSSEGE